MMNSVRLTPQEIGANRLLQQKYNFDFNQLLSTGYTSLNLSGGNLNLVFTQGHYSRWIVQGIDILKGNPVRIRAVDLGKSKVIGHMDFILCRGEICQFFGRGEIFYENAYISSRKFRRAEEGVTLSQFARAMGKRKIIDIYRRASWGLVSYPALFVQEEYRRNGVASVLSLLSFTIAARVYNRDILNLYAQAHEFYDVLFDRLRPQGLRLGTIGGFAFDPVEDEYRGSIYDVNLSACSDFLTPLVGLIK
ncbi:MAG: hypothetical protein V1843_02580 [bacterium]